MITDDGQQENIERVYRKIAPIVCAFFNNLGAGALFHVDELRRFVAGVWPNTAPDSAGRIMRALRGNGMIGYEVVSRHLSLYRITGGATDFDPPLYWENENMDSDTQRRNFTWSYSTLRNYETCPHRHWHYDILRDIKEPESGPLVEGKKIHDAFRERVESGTMLPIGLQPFEDTLGKLAHASGEIQVEQKLALTEGLKPTAFFGPGVWFRTVLDYLNVKPGGTATYIDYKTGRPKDGEELQLELAAVTLFAYRPEITRVKGAFLYTQTSTVDKHEYTRDDATQIWSNVLPRVNEMVQARIDNNYPPKPGPLCKRWCGVTSCKYHGV